MGFKQRVAVWAESKVLDGSKMLVLGWEHKSQHLFSGSSLTWHFFEKTACQNMLDARKFGSATTQ